MRRPSPRARTSASTPPLPKRTSSTTSNLHRRASAPAALPSQSQSPSVDNGLAICLFGVTSSSKMYDAEFEEDRRRRVVMNEVLPDAEMWKKWEKNEAPLRQGRGWYPALDRHFLELLVISEIATLSNPLHAGGPAGQAERVHRHAVRVRRVACERIGQERLGAYCDRVKEAFEAYVSAPARGVGAGEYGGWGVSEEDVLPQCPAEGWSADEDGDGDGDEEEEERGRRLVREGSSEREIGEDRGPDRKVGSWGEETVSEVSMSEGSGSESDDEASTSAPGSAKEEDDLFMEDIDLALPLILGPSIMGDDAAEEDGISGEGGMPALSPTRSDSDTESAAGSVWGGGGEVMGGVKILGDVDEAEEGGEDVEMEPEEKSPRFCGELGVGVAEFVSS